MNKNIYAHALKADDRRVARVVGAEIKKRRTARGMSRRDLAAEIGVTERAVVSWELGDRVPHVRSLYAIAGALRITAGSLIP